MTSPNPLLKEFPTAPNNWLLFPFSMLIELAFDPEHESSGKRRSLSRLRHKMLSGAVTEWVSVTSLLFLVNRYHFPKYQSQRQVAEHPAWTSQPRQSLHSLTVSQQTQYAWNRSHGDAERERDASHLHHGYSALKTFLATGALGRSCLSMNLFRCYHRGEDDRYHISRQCWSEMPSMKMTCLCCHYLSEVVLFYDDPL